MKQKHFEITVIQMYPAGGSVCKDSFNYIISVKTIMHTTKHTHTQPPMQHVDTHGMQ